MNSHRKGIVAYLLIAFGLAWAGLETSYRLKGMPRASGIIFLASSFAPAVACFVVRKWVTREGFADAGLRLHLRKWPYYLVAWLLPVAVMVCVVILAPIFHVGTPDFSMQPGFQFFASAGKPLPAWYPHSFLVLLCFWLVSAIFGAPINFGEEFGWRGYLQKRLFPGNPVLSAVATGIIWGYWHFPAAIRGYSYPDNPILGALIMYPIGCVLLAIIYGWLVQKTGSIWSSSLAHAATNAVGGSLTIFLFGATKLLYASIGGLLGLIPLGALSAWIVFTGQLKPAEAQAPNEMARTAQAN